MQYIRLLLFYSVIFQSCKFQSPQNFTPTPPVCERHIMPPRCKRYEGKSVSVVNKLQRVRRLQPQLWALDSPAPDVPVSDIADYG